jgi:GNAT superfamily N-acetyltransferase
VAGVFRIRTMSSNDVAAATRLVDEAGWNQIAADWNRFLAIEPDGCFVAEIEGDLVGTTVACRFPPVAWLAMVLVAADRRRSGIGRGLVEHAVGWLDDRRIRTIRLDATPPGRAIYEKLGFSPQFEVARYGGKVQAAPSAGGGTGERVVRARLERDLGSILELDHRATRTDRAGWLKAIVSDWPDAVHTVLAGNRLEGFVAARRGARATQIGPCIAQGNAGAALLNDVALRHAGEEVYIDVPEPNGSACALAETIGLGAQRRFVRMCRGEPVHEDLSWVWSSSGPELG